MNFEYSEEQQLLKESIQRWAQDNYSFDQRNVAASMDAGFSDKNWETFAELGWLSVPFAEEDGGFGGGIVDLAAIMEEFGKALTVEPLFSTLVLFGGLVSEAGTADQKAAVLETLIGGGLKGAAALYEPQARFDLSNVKTSAKIDGDVYILSGSKSVVLDAPSGDKLVVLARTSGEQTDEKGLSLFLVDADAKGLSRHDYVLMDAHRASDIVLDGVVGQLMGEADAAYPIVESVMQKAHVALSAEALGIMEKLNATTVEYSKTRKQFGVTISSFQALQHRMVDTFMAFEQTKSLLVGTLCELENPENSEATKATMVAALRTMVAKSGKHVGDEAIQIHGGMGITDELDVGHYVKRLLMINLLFGSGDFFQDQFNQLAYA